MSRKHIAGGCSSRLCRPAAASIISTPSMMFGGPRSRLLQVVHRDHGSLGEDAHPIAEVDCRGSRPAVCRPPGRVDHLGLPHGRLGLGERAGGCRRGRGSAADGGLDGIRPGPPPRSCRRTASSSSRMRSSGRGGDRAGRFADEHQQFDRHPGPFGHLRERDAAERREPLEGRRVEEVERDAGRSGWLRPRPSSGMPDATRLAIEAGAAEMTRP